MSYSCSISFIDIDKSDITDFFVHYKKEIRNHMSEVAEDEYLWVPYIKDNIWTDSKKFPEWSDLPYNDKLMAERWAQTCVFSYRYFYSDKYHLLGIFSIPKCMYHMFDGTVYFQNSCDQDYDLKDWDNIKQFEEVYNKWQNVPEKVIAVAYNEDMDENVSDDKLKERISYFRRSKAYDEIWENIEYALELESEVVYVSLFNSIYDYEAVKLFLIHCHKYMEEHIKEGEKYYQEMLEGKHPEMQETINHIKESFEST